MELLGLFCIPVWCVMTLSTIILLYIYGTWNFSLWSSQGVAGPPPAPFLGNIHEIFSKTPLRAYSEYQQKYGNNFGVFFGARPLLVVTELSLVKEILAKRFANFYDRNFFDDERPIMIDRSLFFATGSVWKRIRRLMSPAFTTSKLKLMSPYIKRCTKFLVQNVDRKVQKDEAVPLKDLYSAFTLDAIAGTAFGIETNSQTEEAEPFVLHMRGFFHELHEQWSKAGFIILINVFPFIIKILGMLGASTAIFKSEHVQFFINTISQLVEDRRKHFVMQSEKPTDMLQMMMDAEDDSDVIAATPDARRMSKDEILGQSFIVLLGGYDTVASTLQYLTFHLTHRPDVQDRLYQEIINNVSDEDPTYHNVKGLKYLHAALLETLRLYPPIPWIDRKANEKARIQGITIPAGCGVLIPIYAIMHDPQLFHDPEQFLPERHLEENCAALDPMLQELVFGYGPRQCIGMRLALLELKFVAVTLIRKFRFLKSPDTPERITFTNSFVTLVPTVPIKVKAERRDQ